MNVRDFIKNLQNKPYETRVKILWGGVIVIGILLVFAWVFSLKSTISGLDKNSSANSAPAETPTAKTQYITIERAETSAGNLRIYFKIKNPSNDILNFSKLEDIKLVAGGRELSPVKLLDRQNKPFVQKILSKTENFGMLTFLSEMPDEGKLSFDQLFFENQPQLIFKETSDLDFSQLVKTEELRH